MNDIRRTILWVIFAFSVVMLWDQWQVHNGHPATFIPRSPAVEAGTAPKNASAADTSAVVPKVSAASVGAPQETVAAPVAVQLHEVSTDVLKMTFSSAGGTLVRAELLAHKDQADRSAALVLLDSNKGKHYVASTGLTGAPGANLPNHTTPMQFAGASRLPDGQDTLEVRFTSEPQGGVQLIKTYTLKRGAYVMDVRHEVKNLGEAPLAGAHVYLQLERDGSKPSGESMFYTTFTGPAIYSEAKKYQKVEFSAVDKNKATFEKQASNGYVAMVQHYFASAWLLADGVARENFVQKLSSGHYTAGMTSDLGSVAPGQSRVFQSRLFVGPQEEKILEALAPGLELVKDYGWFTVLAKPLYWLLDKLYHILQNWGWAIMALVLLLKIAFYWLNAKAYSSMAKMKAINPRIMEMRERLKNNPQQMQQEMMKMYREEKVNPLGGCFPIMVQIPVFIALYWVLLSSVEMRHAPWIGWIGDLSAPDPYFILPVIMTLTTMLQTALNPLPPDPMQAKLMWIMPLVFSVMFFFFPSGLVLYWITNNILSIAQQWIINTRMGVPPQFNLPKFK
jgi:YidC/Oxa1 family membrane protein insertase